MSESAAGIAQREARRRTKVEAMELAEAWLAERRAGAFDAAQLPLLPDDEPDRQTVASPLFRLDMDR